MVKRQCFVFLGSCNETEGRSRGRCIGYRESFSPFFHDHIYMRASEEFVFAYSQSGGGRDSFVFSFLFIGFRGCGAQQKHVTSSFTSRAWGTSMSPGDCIWGVSIFTSSFPSIRAGSELGWLGTRTKHHSTRHYSLFSAFMGLHSAARITPGKPSSSSESLHVR